ncbi:hypothetical protein C2869_02850 [Saccharobesus litoralis]|uniref:Uncharacterized protein n=1 Tax=Saccharobesus litoralis TaxID=2172099 RepID=A0A2S0VMJ0_9ALTE|nr:hypothetical protein C2869_02850 [Saccharobesus litoralis]
MVLLASIESINQAAIVDKLLFVEINFDPQGCKKCHGRLEKVVNTIFTIIHAARSIILIVIKAKYATFLNT